MASGLPGIPFTPAARCVLVKPVPRARGRGGDERVRVSEERGGGKPEKEKH